MLSLMICQYLLLEIIKLSPTYLSFLLSSLPLFLFKRDNLNIGWAQKAFNLKKFDILCLVMKQHLQFTTFLKTHFESNFTFIIQMSSFQTTEFDLISSAHKHSWTKSLSSAQNLTLRKTQILNFWINLTIQTF